MNSELARGCVSKLLLEVAIDLRLNFLYKFQFFISGFVYFEDS